MIAPSTGFWKAFLDPANPDHQKARSDIRVFDREEILLSEFVIAEVVSWLLEKGKIRQKDWFLDYAVSTANTRIFHFGREEFAGMARISRERHVPLAEASLAYLRAKLNCDLTGY